MRHLKLFEEWKFEPYNKDLNTIKIEIKGVGYAIISRFNGKNIVEQLFVNKEYRSRGYGKIIMEKVIEIAKEKKMFPLYLYAAELSKETDMKLDDLIWFYKRFGFEMEDDKKHLMVLKILDERAIPAEELVNAPNIGLIEKTKNRYGLPQKVLILFDFDRDAMLGYIDMMKLSHKGPYKLEHSAAEKNYGPDIYDFALMSAYPDGVRPSWEIRQAAQHVWEYYIHNRSDVKKVVLPTDDEDYVDHYTVDIDHEEEHDPEKLKMVNTVFYLSPSKEYKELLEKGKKMWTKDHEKYMDPEARRKYFKEKYVHESESVVQTKIKLYHGIKDPKNVDDILKHGFDLRKIHPLWMNDYAVSAMTSPKAVRSFFGRDVPILELEFDGTLGDTRDANVFFTMAHDARDYTRRIVEAGIDAIRLDSDIGVHQVFVYNPKAIKNITLLK